MNTTEHDAASLSPAASAAVFKQISDGSLEQQLTDMLNEFDNLVPEQYEGYDRPYQPLSKRMDLFEKHIPFGDLMIYTELLKECSTPGMVYCRATLHILTEEGYAPLFSRLGEGNSMTSRTDGAIADAETSATRRILIALGLSNDGGNDEFTVLKDSAQRDFITNYLNSRGKKLDALIKAFNAKNSAQERIDETRNQSGVSDLSIADVIKLRRHLES